MKIFISPEWIYPVAKLNINAFSLSVLLMLGYLCAILEKKQSTVELVGPTYTTIDSSWLDVYRLLHVGRQ